MASQVLQKIKSQFREIRRGVAGRRFSAYYRRRERQEASRGKSLWGWAYIVVGLVLIACGLLFSLVPGVPGFLFAIPGLAMLAARSQGFASMLDRSEVWLRRNWRRFRPARRP